jgi:hypothetical protein
MREWLDLGSSPPAEPCAQLGRDGYYAEARKECQAYIALLRRTVGEEPEGAQLSIRSNPHDFGTYLSVVCYYDPAIEGAMEYAFRCESEGPDEWDEVARNELSHTRKENRS